LWYENMYIKILCDDRYSQDLTYEIESEKIVNPHTDICEKCAKYQKCQGWAKIFNQCQEVE